MYCPKCKDQNLHPTKLEDGLPVMGCEKCGGAFLSLLHYRDWVERFEFDTQQNDNSDELESVETDNDTKTALCCPKCGKIMTKFSVVGNASNRIDLCGSCDESWLDGGEWSLLKSLALGDKLPKIFTQQWQQRVRNEKTELGRIERLEKMVGAADAEKAVEMKQWLSDKKHKATILRFLAAE